MCETLGRQRLNWLTLLFFICWCAMLIGSAHAGGVLQTPGPEASTVELAVDEPLAPQPEQANTRGQQQDESTNAGQESTPNQLDLARGLLLSARAFRQAERRVRPALVTIESFGGVSAIAGKIGGIRNQGEGNTTGVMISPEGHIITSLFNFIEQPPVITVITSDGQRRVAKLLGRDDTRKICLLKIEGR